MPSICLAKTKERPIVKAVKVGDLLLFTSNSFEFHAYSKYLDKSVINELSLKNAKKSEYIFVWNLKNSEWEFYIPIYIIVFDNKREKDVQDIYVTLMKKSDIGVTIVNKMNDTLSVDIVKQAIHPLIKVYKAQ